MVQKTTTDVAVIGSGATGLVAALTLAEGGARVILIEKMRSLGGISNFAEGMFQENVSTRLALKIMITLMKEVGLNFRQRIKAIIMAGKLYLKELSELKLYDGVKELIEFFEKN